MNPISALQATNTLSTLQAKSTPQESAALRLMSESTGKGSKPELKSAFQDVVAGTFYKEMMKSLKKMHNKPAYFHGGQAEDMFQSQLDQQVSEDLAHSRGGPLADSLYQAFLHNSRA